MTRNGVNQRLTVEKLAQDCLNVSDLNKAGALKGGWVTIRTGICWPAIEE